MKFKEKNHPTVQAKIYSSREDKKENVQVQRKKIYKAKSETKDVPANDGKRPDLISDNKKISSIKSISAVGKKGGRPSTSAVPGLTTHRQQKQKMTGMY